MPPVAFILGRACLVMVPRLRRSAPPRRYALQSKQASKGALRTPDAPKQAIKLQDKQGWRLLRSGIFESTGRSEVELIADEQPHGHPETVAVLAFALAENNKGRGI